MVYRVFLALRAAFVPVLCFDWPVLMNLVLALRHSLSENKKALVAKDQSQVPKMLIKREMQRCIQRLDRCTIWDQPQKTVFYIQDRVMDSFEIQRMRIS